ncbi:MAG: hypothetical protein JW883_08855, partial [Deltaproteobacteria bacterium]|nr:hypothetical protein [Deltaproteobacteria bacterium]
HFSELFIENEQRQWLSKFPLIIRSGLRLNQWPSMEIIFLDRDGVLQEIKDRWPSASPNPLENITLEYLQHINLFYSYRNSLVHDLKEPGYGMEFENDEEPFYQYTRQVEGESSTWELVYPVRFYEKICDSAIKNLREYYLNKRIDPYSCYTFGTYWIEGLNR